MIVTLLVYLCYSCIRHADPLFLLMKLYSSMKESIGMHVLNVSSAEHARKCWLISLSFQRATKSFAARNASGNTGIIKELHNNYGQCSNVVVCF